MRRKRSPVSAALELAAVLLATALAFAWGKQTALAERGYEAAGGEYMLLLLPVIYYAGKRTALDWAQELRQSWRELKKKTAPDGTNIGGGRPKGQI